MALSAVVNDLERLQQLYAEGFQDAFLDAAVRRIIDHQITRDEADLARLDDRLTHLERQYGWDSTTFWDRYQAGQLGDVVDYVEWSALCKMRRRILARLGILRSEASDA